MLLAKRLPASVAEKISVRKILAVGLSVGVLMEVLAIVGVGNTLLPPGDLNKGIDIGTVEFIGRQLYTSYLLPFEVTSILLLAAIVGAIVLAKKKLE